MRSDEVLRAHQNTALRRYDVLVELQDFYRFSAEEIHVYRNHAPGDESTVIFLTARRSTTQLNMKARGQDEGNLVLVPWQDVRNVYREIFEPVAAALANLGEIPAVLEQLVTGPDWEQRLLEEHAARTLSDEEALAAWTYLIDHLDEIKENADGHDANVDLFLRFLLDEFTGQFRPIVWLSPGNRDEWVLLKYITQSQREDATNLHRLCSALLGWYPVRLMFQPELNASFHARIRPPKGMIIEGLGENPEGEVGSGHSPSQLQFYVREDHTQSFVRQNDRLPVSKYEIIVGQALSVRFLVGILYLSLTLFPILRAVLEIPEVWDSYWAFDPMFILRDFTRIMQVLDPQHAIDASTLVLPLVFGLVAIIWDRPPIRTYVIIQLLILIVMIFGWLLATGGPDGHGLPAVAGAATLIVGLVLGGHNLGRCAIISWGGLLQPRRWKLLP